MKTKTKFIPFFGLPFLVIIVGIIQLYKTETTQLSRWKGGGFGMYTSIHRSYYVITINEDIFSLNQFRNTDVSLKKRTKLEFLQNPNDLTALAFYDLLKSPTDTTIIKLYQPKVDVEENTLTYQLFYEKNIIKDTSCK